MKLKNHYLAVMVIEKYIKYNSNVNIVDKDGYNSLFYAVKSRSLEICEIIIKYICVSFNKTLINQKIQSYINIIFLKQIIIPCLCVHDLSSFFRIKWLFNSK